MNPDLSIKDAVNDSQGSDRARREWLDREMLRLSEERTAIIDWQSLSHADATAFRSLAVSMGLECEGPSARGSFLVREANGRCWLFGANYADKFGRTMVPSVWTDLNIAVMRRRLCE